MSLLHPPSNVKLRTTLTIGCTMARGKPGWCRGLCEPVDGIGACGRVAPHAMTSRVQQAILDSRACAEPGWTEPPTAAAGRGG